MTRGAHQRALRRTNGGPATSASSASARKQAVLRLERKRESVLTRLGPFMPGSEAEASELASPWHLAEAYEESCLATLITEEARRRLLATGLARDGDDDNRWARVLLSAYGRDLVALSAVRQRLGGRWLGARAKGEAERSARRRFTAVVVEIEAEQRSAAGMVGRGPVAVPSVAVGTLRESSPPSAPIEAPAPAAGTYVSAPEHRPSRLPDPRSLAIGVAAVLALIAILLTRPFAGGEASTTLGAAGFTQQAIRGLNMDAVVAAAERAEARAAARERARERAAALAAARERARERAAREAALAEAAAEEPAPEESTTTAEAPVEPAAPVASAPAPAPAPAAPAPAAPAPEPEPAPSGGGDNCFTFEC